MERTLTAEERIRRAEEIYNKRKMQNLGVRLTANSTNNGTKPDYKLLKRMGLQILICIMIYIIFYMIQNTNYIFSTDVINKTKEILSYDINFEKVFNNLSSYLNEIINLNSEKKEKEIENTEEQTNKDSNNQESKTEEPPITEENIGGADNLPNEESQKEELSQMEIDANYIKSKYILIKPIQGTITSRYGLRNPTTVSIPKNHTGIDIAANTGTIIYAALDGVVKIASSEGDYGNHLRIEKDDIAIYYAHCSKLYVREGQEIKQGDAIAEVGSTRKCNRSTFTF